MNNDLADAQSFPECTFEGSIFFYCLQSAYQPLSICLAEGLKQLRIPFYSNVNFWQISPEKDEYLFNHHPSITPDDCAVVLVEKGWVLKHRSLPDNLFHTKRNYITVYLDDADGPTTPARGELGENFDFIFRTHCNNKSDYPVNFIPWVFGLSNRVLRETQSVPDFQHKTKRLLVNFRVPQTVMVNRGDSKNRLPAGLVRISSQLVKVEHPLRQIVRDCFCPLIEPILPMDDRVDEFEQPPSDAYHYLQWQQTERRHYPSYYQRLTTSAACAAFGGYIVPGTHGTNSYVEWWDSWRFWESIAAGCVTFHADLEKYGASLPIMPKNWQHYIGIDLDNIEGSIHRITSTPGILERISQAGRQWVIENYAPLPTAIRFLETIGCNSSSSSKNLMKQDRSLTFSLPVSLNKFNFIIFPDWSQNEEILYKELKQVIRAITTHPQRIQMTLLINTNGISEEDVNLVLSGMVMNLLMQEDLDVTEEVEISLTGNLQESQWAVLWPHLQARILLENEDWQAIAHSRAEAHPSCELERFSHRRFGPLSSTQLNHELFQQEKWQEAIDYYQSILETQVGEADLYWCLSECFRHLNFSEQSLNILQEGIQHYQIAGNFYFSASITLQLKGYIQEAIEVAKAALAFLPDDYTFKILKNLLLPIIYDSPEEISVHRQRFVQGLQELINETSLDTPEEQRSTLEGISRFTIFYLSYQAQNDIALHRQYGNLVHQIMATNYPRWVTPLSMPPLEDNQKIRIGYVSAYLHAYSGTYWLTGWLQHCDKERFEIYCYYTGKEPDAVTKQFQNCSNVFYHIPHNLEAVCEQIIADRLHIVIFPEIGMDPLTVQMAGLRLAPVQCAAWGHPVTTGLPTIDYFLSSELMEPEDAGEHYSEILIRLPNIGVSYPKPYIPPITKTRPDFQLQEDAVIYFCCQAPFKYLPQYDRIFAEIARRVPKAQFVFLRGNLLRQRLERAFSEVGLRSKDYCVFLTIPERLDYLALNLLSDVYLDTFTWSGGNTTLEAIACSLPIVTCPGEFMRGRHSYSFLKMLEVTDTIARDEADYIEIAVRLGLDSTWRNQISERIEQSCNRLFDDKACVVALEAFYKQIVRECLAKNF